MDIILRKSVYNMEVRMDKTNNKEVNKRLFHRIIISSLLLLTLFFSKQFITFYQMTQETNTSYILNIAGRQRMLSQKIVKDMALINIYKSTSKTEKYKKDLKSSLELWEKSHQELLNLNKIKRFVGWKRKYCYFAKKPEH